MSEPPESLGPRALHAPWRLSYLEGLSGGGGAQTPAAPGPQPGHGGSDPGGSARPSPAGFLHDYWLNPQLDEQNHVVCRDKRGMVLLNRYPYANGHLLVALGEPRPRLLDYAEAERAHLWRLVERGVRLMQETLEPQGLNVGMNEGAAAGAGLPGHLHVHLVPRWSGDVNFMATVGQVRVIPSSLEAMAARYREAAKRLGWSS